MARRFGHLLIAAALAATMCGSASAQPGLTARQGQAPAIASFPGNGTGAYATHRYRNLFTEQLGRSPAESRAKIVYERLINITDDPGIKDALGFLMTREIAHQKSFEKALYTIENNFPPGKLPGVAPHTDMYVNASQGEGDMQGPWNSGEQWNRVDDLNEVLPADSGGDGTAAVKLGASDARAMAKMEARLKSDTASDPMTGSDLGAGPGAGLNLQNFEIDGLKSVYATSVLQQNPVRVAVLNDYEIVVAGVAAMLAPHHDRVVVVELDSGLPVVSDVDVILYDTFGQVQGDAVDLEDLVRGNSVPVAIFSWNLQSDLVERAIAHGASGYLSKGLDARAVVDAIEAIHRGETVVPPSSVVSADRDVAGEWPGREVGLTAREAEVLALITQGLSNQEIADQTYLSINSVKTYIRTAYRKIEVTRRSQAVAWGMTHGFAPDRIRRVATGH